MEPKAYIFHLLNRADGAVSGEALSQALKVSRVSIWKHVKGMVQQGVAIESTPKGYRLLRDPDSLHPWAFARRSSSIHFFRETTSTMDEALSLARGGCPAFTVVVARRQTHGRGRMRRTWSSGDGGLYFTVVLRPDIPLASSGLVNMAAAVDLANDLRSTYRVDARVKWPNDILVDGRKLCGILSQMEVEGNRISYLNIGIGLNVNNRPEIDEPSAVAMKTLVGTPVPRSVLLQAFLERFQERIEAFDPGDVLQQWHALNVTLGRQVRVVTPAEVLEGTALEVDEQGGLILRTADGARRMVLHGDCFHRVPGGQ